MESILELFKHLTNADWITQHGGLYLVALIVFAETGLFVGFFLPGDSLLFVTGLIIAQSASPFDTASLNLPYWIVLITLAGIIGNLVGYWFGKKTGPILFERKDTWLFKRKHLLQAKEFYEKKGGSAIILARFIPIVRTFAPIVAGVVHMERKKFLIYNIVGSFAWVLSMTITGYCLGENEWVKGNLEKIVIGLILVTTLPVLYKMIFAKKRA
ncbi:MAG: hypothetical protein RLZZ605_1049 [Bacteroidota bacterium]|jgi:membrane-associated protein